MNAGFRGFFIKTRYHLNKERLDLREVGKHFLESPRHSAHLPEVGYVHRAILRRYQDKLKNPRLS